MKTFAFIQRSKSALPLISALLFLTALTAFSQRPEIYLSTGHSSTVTSIAFSPDGRTLATGSYDYTVKLWDVASGQELQTLRGPSKNVFSVVFSPDSKILVVGGESETIVFWEVATGQELKALNTHSYRVRSVAFSPDGKTLAIGSNYYAVRLFDVASGQELPALKGHSDEVTSVAFSPDGRTLVSGSYDKTVKLWDMASGSLLKTLEGHLDIIHSVAFSPDGRRLASGSYDKTAKLWDIASGLALKTLKVDSLMGVNSVAFNIDGSRLATGGWDGAVKLWDATSGAELRTLQGHSTIVDSVVFSPDGKMLASGSADQAVKIWDWNSGRELQTLKGRIYTITSVGFSPDGRTLASGSGDHTIKLWDLALGRNMSTLVGFSEEVDSVVFSRDGKTIAGASMDSPIRTWTVDSGRQFKTFGDKFGNFSVAFSPDGKMLAIVPASGSITLWNVHSGRKLKVFGDDESSFCSVAFSPDGKTLVGSYLQGGATWWNVASRRKLRNLDFGCKGAFSPDGKTFAIPGISPTELFDVISNRKLKTFGNSSDWSVAFSPDGKTLASASASTVKLWDVASGQELKTLLGHQDFVESVTFSKDGRTLASGSRDGTIKLWEVSSGIILCSLIAIDEKDWIVVTPDGLFDGSPSAWNKINWRFSQNLYDLLPVEAYFSDFYYPGLLSEIFAGKRPKASEDISTKDRRQPQLKLSASDIQSSGVLTGRNLKVKIDISQTPAGAKDLRLFRNGSLVKVWHGDVLKGQASVTLEATIPIVAGENNFTAYAFNHDNVKSSDATLTVTGADSLKRRGVAYVLAVGVNQYANTQYNLTYAVPDAQDFSAELKRQQEKLGNYERVEVIPLNDKDATKANILKALADLSTKIQPEDSLTIYFAGHGTAKENRFYLIPHDLGYTGPRDGLSSAGLQTILAHSISDEELEAAVEGIDAGQMLLVIDACNSGQALEAEEKRRGPMNSKGLAQLAYEKGMYILTAAQSYQAAQEATKLGHGFLTYALVEEGLKTSAADREPKDGQVFLREWLNFATERVPQMQQDDLKTRELQREKVTATAKTARASGDNLQRPRVFYRRETEPHPLVVVRP